MQISTCTKLSIGLPTSSHFSSNQFVRVLYLLLLFYVLRSLILPSIQFLLDNFGTKYNVTALQKQIPSAARLLQWKNGFDTEYVATDSGVSFYD